jgi:hypothetical protein
LLICENELNEILNLEMRRLISNKKIFENLTHEKPTKRFLDVAHNVGKGDKLSNLLDDNGQPFESNEKLKEYVTNFYSNLYSQDLNVNGSIEDFLGERICNSHLVQSSKLTKEQKTNLEQDLTYEELEKSLGESNLKSAPINLLKNFSTYLAARFSTAVNNV